MSQAALWQVTRMFKIPDVKLLEQIYGGATLRLAPNNQESATITFNTGVAQSSTTSPQLFHIFINALLRMLTVTGQNEDISHGLQIDKDQKGDNFNTISLPALFLLLRKFCMNENDVQALESYYEHSHMRVVHADGEKSAKIPLYRGLRQGCPLSPILGGVVVNAMLRWLDFKGGGLSQGDVVTNTLCFADDSTLMTTNVHDMNVLLACVNSYCQWAGVKINMGKTEVTGYDYKRKCPLDLSILQLGNGKPKIVMPWDPVKYLGVRLTITGDLTFERDYVRKKTLDTIKQLIKHMYHPQ